jgi:hypothetical protein
MSRAERIMVAGSIAQVLSTVLVHGPTVWAALGVLARSLLLYVSFARAALGTFEQSLLLYGSTVSVVLCALMKTLPCQLAVAMTLFVQLALAIWAKSRGSDAKVNAVKLIAVLLLLLDGYWISDVCPDIGRDVLKAFSLT